jgi:hypothetical protein
VHFRAEAQDLLVNVEVKMELLQQSEKDKLNNFKQNVENYMKKNKFAVNNIPPVPANLSFNFKSADGLDNYEVTLIILSKREFYNPDRNATKKFTQAFRFNDERVSFSYNRAMPMVRNDVRFDSFLSLLDYYAYIILGYDEDSYYVKGGNKYFQKGLDICNKPIQNKKGWTETGGGSKPSRVQIVQELLNSRFDDYRKAYFEYMWMGIDSISINKRNAFEHILNALEKISTVNKNEVRAYNIDIFFEAQYNVIAEIFQDYDDKKVYDRLIKIDPSHQRTYEEARARLR